MVRQSDVRHPQHAGNAEHGQFGQEHERVAIFHHDETLQVVGLQARRVRAGRRRVGGREIDGEGRFRVRQDERRSRHRRLRGTENVHQTEEGRQRRLLQRMEHRSHRHTPRGAEKGSGGEVEKEQLKKEKRNGAFDSRDE